MNSGIGPSFRRPGLFLFGCFFWIILHRGIACPPEASSASSPGAVRQAPRPRPCWSVGAPRRCSCPDHLGGHVVGGAAARSWRLNFTSVMTSFSTFDVHLHDVAALGIAHRTGAGGIGEFRLTARMLKMLLFRCTWCFLQKQWRPYKSGSWSASGLEAACGDRASSRAGLDDSAAFLSRNPHRPSVVSLPRDRRRPPWAIHAAGRWPAAHGRDRGCRWCRPSAGSSTPARSRRMSRARLPRSARRR